MILTSKQVYEKLIHEDRILEQKGEIRFYFGNVDIIVKQRDVVGNIIQEWLQGWLVKNGIEFAPSENTQMPPDFFLNPNDKETDLLEVKAFNRSAGPGFDIADFNMYQNEIIEEPYMLDADYLIFGYDMSKDGVVTVKDLWLKKVWEITRPMPKEGWAINLQKKKGIVHKIRPGIWYSDQKGNTPMFKCLEDFISAIEQTVYQNPATRDKSATWLNKFLASYKKYYGKNLEIQRWNDIKDKYSKSE